MPNAGTRVPDAVTRTFPRQAVAQQTKYSSVSLITRQQDIRAKHTERVVVYITTQLPLPACRQKKQDFLDMGHVSLHESI
jgi:hypothetical protein